MTKNKCIRKCLPSWALAIILVLSFLTPAQAIVQARVWDWLARLNRLIPAPELRLCQENVDSLPLTANLEEMRSLLNTLDLKLPEEPIELYATIRLLLRKDKELTLLSDNLEANQEGQKLLHNYKEELASNYATLDSNSNDSSLLIAVPDFEVVKNVNTDQYIEVLRPLPRFNQSWKKADAKLCLEAAQSDLEYLHDQEQQLKDKIKQLAANAKPFRQHVRTLSNQLDPATGLPKREKNNEFPNLILPPPPVDLPVLQKNR
ncbi:TPA: hypothetical protein DD394_01810 [bacterium UBP9_UBA11836]|nr:hypothetical protein [bacterium UBP9_UBA11836]